MKCIVLEDDEIAATIVKRYIDKTDFLDLQEIFTNASAAQNFIIDEGTDLVISDILLPDISGMEMIKMLKNPPQVIFTTSSREHAIEGFEMQVADYLLKPVSYERFLKAANRAHEMHKAAMPTLPTGNTTRETPKDHFFIRSDFAFIKINLRDIIYLQSLKDYVRIVTTTDTHLTAMNLVTIEEKLPPADFLRIHRSTIIQRNRVEMLKNNDITVSGHTLAIGKNYKDLVYNDIVNDNFLKR